MEETIGMKSGGGYVWRSRGAAASLLAALLFAAGAITAQVVPDTSLSHADLQEIIRLDTTIHLDIRYATAKNFMGRPMYAEARAFLQRPAAEALLRAQRKLRWHGYGIVVFDAYRPWSVTKKFWDETPPSKRKFVADPRKGSRHNRGCAVDCSLYDLATGKEVSMPTAYDDFSPAASPNAHVGTPEQRARRDLLRTVMQEEGFHVESNEWWHFDYHAWRRYPVLDVPFSRLH
jgi:D-alanyl-D-alanine dipeptidase